MKWYSCKTHAPATTGAFYFVRNSSISGLAIAFYDYQVDIGFFWEDTETREIILNVTHFCYPDPIEVE